MNAQTLCDNFNARYTNKEDHLKLAKSHGNTINLHPRVWMTPRQMRAVWNGHMNVVTETKKPRSSRTNTQPHTAPLEATEAA